MTNGTDTPPRLGDIGTQKIFSRRCHEIVRRKAEEKQKPKRKTIDIGTIGDFVATFVSPRPFEDSKTIKKREIINVGTIGDFFATFASLGPLEASKNAERSSIFDIFVL